MKNTYILRFTDETVCNERKFTNIGDYYCEMQVKNLEEGFKIINHLKDIFNLESYTGNAYIGEWPIVTISLYFTDVNQHRIRFSLEYKNN